MNFAKALKCTDAAARIARLMAALSVLCREASPNNAHTRLFWLMAMTPMTSAPHVAKRIDATMDACEFWNGSHVAIRMDEIQDQLLAIVDEIKAAVEQVPAVRRRPDDSDEGRRPLPSGIVPRQ